MKTESERLAMLSPVSAIVRRSDLVGMLSLWCLLSLKCEFVFEVDHLTASSVGSLSHRERGGVRGYGLSMGL